MNHQPDPKIESTLRNAPNPTPPEGLLEDLLRDSSLAMKQSASQRTRTAVRPASLLGTWIPRLGFALVFLLGAAFITAQSNRYPSKQEAEAALKQAELRRTQLVGASQKASQLRGRLEYLNQLKQQQAEVIELRDEKEQLLALVEEAQQLQASNQQLQEQLTRYAGQNSYLNRDHLGEAREKSREIMCINNLKQIGLAYRIAESENDVAEDFYDLIPRLGGTAIPLYCPSDKNKVQASGEGQESVGPENISYQWKLDDPALAAPITVLARCPIHDHVGLFDGSVQHGKALAEGKAKLVEDRGNFRFEMNPR